MARVANPLPESVAAGGGAQRVEFGAPPPKATREALLVLIVKLLKEKSGSVAHVQQKVRSGEGLLVKGVKVGTSILQEALAQVGAGAGLGNNAAPGCPPTVGTGGMTRSARPVATPTATTNGLRFTVGAPSAAALAGKALQECDTAEPFVRKAKNLSEQKIQIYTKPNILSHPTGGYLDAGEVFEVIARCARVQDGRTYLRLRRSEGWVPTRFACDFWKVALGSAEGGASLEPKGCPTVFQSKAAQVLSKVDAAGERVVQALYADPKPAKTFRVLGGRGQPIFTHPNILAHTSGGLQAREEFLADAVCILPEDGRVYLRIQDGRGWVCERTRADFSRHAVEQVKQVSSRERQDVHEPSTRADFSRHAADQVSFRGRQEVHAPFTGAVFSQRAVGSASSRVRQEVLEPSVLPAKRLAESAGIDCGGIDEVDNFKATRTDTTESWPQDDTLEEEVEAALLGTQVKPQSLDHAEGTEDKPQSLDHEEQDDCGKGAALLKDPNFSSDDNENPSLASILKRRGRRKSEPKSESGNGGDEEEKPQIVSRRLRRKTRINAD